MKLFRKYRTATLLNVLGMSVAIAAFYLFMTPVIFDLTYNHSVKNY